MVAGFKRYLSCSMRRASECRPTEKPHRGQSMSHSCLADEIHALRSWLSRPTPNLSWFSSGLDRIEPVISSLSNLLLLHQCQEPIRRWADRLLEDSLRLADAYGTLRFEIAAVRDHQSASQSAIRRRDEVRLAASARSTRATVKELLQLAAVVRNAIRKPGSVRRSVSDGTMAEMEWMVREAMVVTALATEKVVLRIAARLSGNPASVGSLGKTPSTLAGKRMEMEDDEWRRRELGRLEELEGTMGALQSGCERVFTILVNIRVFLLSTISPSL